jgi:hypothetical protein
MRIRRPHRLHHLTPAQGRSLGWQSGTMVAIAATGFIAGRAIFSLGAIHRQIHGSSVRRARIVIRLRTSTSGTVGFSYRWIRLPTSRILMWATLGPMSGFPEHDDHRHRICRWATGGGHGGVAGSVAAADTATSYEVPRVAQPYKFSRFGDRARGMDSPPPGV